MGSMMRKTMTTDDYLNSLKTDDYLNSFSVRYNFGPINEELLIHYLKKKVLNKTLSSIKIGEVNLYNYTPEQLFDKYRVRGEKVIYFFTYQTYGHGKRPNRLVAGGNGHWKAVGGDVQIGSTENPIGYKKSLVYHHQNGKKTGWIMQEYRLDQNTLPDKVTNDLVLCKVHNKFEKNKMNSSVCSTNTIGFPIEKADECHAAADNNLKLSQEPPQANQCNCFTPLGFLFQKLIVVANYAIAMCCNNNRSEEEEDALTPMLQ